MGDGICHHSGECLSLVMNIDQFENIKLLFSLLLLG